MPETEREAAADLVRTQQRPGPRGRRLVLRVCCLVLPFCRIGPEVNYSDLLSGYLLARANIRIVS